MSEGIEKFKEELQKNGLRVTQSRLSVFTILKRNADKFLSSDDIFDKISKSKLQQCDRVSVYRVLSSLEKIGLVKVGHFQGEASKYQLHLHSDNCHNCHEEHQHYFKCTGCGSIDPIGGCLFDDNINELTKMGYKSETHHFEVTGLCPRCNK